MKPSAKAPRSCDSAALTASPPAYLCVRCNAPWQPGAERCAECERRAANTPQAQVAALRAQLAAVTAERDQLRADLRSQFTAAFAKLRETLGSDIGTGGGLVEILDGIDQLRAQRDTLMAAASAICRARICRLGIRTRLFAVATFTT